MSRIPWHTPFQAVWPTDPAFTGEKRGPATAFVKDRTNAESGFRWPLASVRGLHGWPLLNELVLPLNDGVAKTFPSGIFNKNRPGRNFCATRPYRGGAGGGGVGKPDWDAIELHPMSYCNSDWNSDE